MKLAREVLVKEMLNENITRGTAYAKLEVYSDKDRDVRFSLYGEGKLEFFVDGTSAYKSDGIVYEDEISLSLKEGINRILVKVSFDFPKPYSGREFGFRLRLSEPVEGLLFLE